MGILIGGFDPSMSNFGMVKGELNGSSFALSTMSLVSTESSKVKSVRKSSDDLRRAKELHTAMVSFFEDVDVVCVEVPVGSQTARAMCSYGMCIGLLASLDKPLIQVTPTENKKIVTGTKAGTKEQMIKWAVAKHPDAPWLTRKVKGEVTLVNKNEHLADALITIYAAMQTDQFKIIQQLRK